MPMQGVKIGYDKMVTRVQTFGGAKDNLLLLHLKWKVQNEVI